HSSARWADRRLRAGTTGQSWVNTVLCEAMCGHAGAVKSSRGAHVTRTDVSRPRADVSAGWSSRSDGLLALAGAGIFAAMVVLLHFVENEFEPSSRFISEYVLGGWGWLRKGAC